MRKVTYLAAAALMGATIAATPLQAMAAGPMQYTGTNANGRVKIFTAGSAACADIESLKDLLNNCQAGNMQIITIPCMPGNQNGNGTPDMNTPETETPGTETPGEEDSDNSVHAYVLRIVELVNEERAKAGINPLTLQENVTEAAQVRAVECETLFSHTRPNGTSFSTALKEAGVSYRGAGENIAWGQKTPEQVMQGWMNSAGHRANILNEKYTTIGVGYYQNAAGVNYWSQLFTY